MFLSAVRILIAKQHFYQNNSVSDKGNNVFINISNVSIVCHGCRRTFCVNTGLISQKLTINQRKYLNVCDYSQEIIETVLSSTCFKKISGSKQERIKTLSQDHSMPFNRCIQGVLRLMCCVNKQKTKYSLHLYYLITSLLFCWRADKLKRSSLFISAYFSLNNLFKMMRDLMKTSENYLQNSFRGHLWSDCRALINKRRLLLWKCIDTLPWWVSH